MSVLAQGGLFDGKFRRIKAERRTREAITLMPLPERIAHHEAAAAELQRLGEGWRGTPRTGAAYLQAAANCRAHIARLKAELEEGQSCE